MPPIVSIGIDPGLTNTGVCVGDGEDVRLYKLIQPPKMLRGVERLDFITKELHYFIADFKGATVAIEGYDYKGFSTIPLAEVNAVLCLTCHRLGMPVIHVSPSQVKKFATGNSQADKADIIARYDGRNEHLADARALAEIAQALVLGTSTVRHELEVIYALKQGKKPPKPRVKRLKLLPVAL